MSEQSRDEAVAYINSIDPESEWYRGGRLGLGYLTRLRSIAIAVISQAIGAMASAGFGHWALAIVLVLSAIAVGCVLFTIRSYRIRRMKAEEALHRITHEIRERIRKIKLSKIHGEYKIHFDELNTNIVENIADFFRERSNDSSANCIIRLASIDGESELYTTVARSKGLAEERETNSEPARIDEGIVKAIRERKNVGAFLIRDVSQAINSGFWKPTMNDQLVDAQTWFVAPINGYVNSKNQKSMLGILHITSRKDRFNVADWIPLKMLCDLLGMLYGEVLQITREEEQKEEAFDAN